MDWILQEASSDDDDDAHSSGGRVVCWGDADIVEAVPRNLVAKQVGLS